jgi:hypothetical protein
LLDRGDFLESADRAGIAVVGVTAASLQGRDE